MVEHRADQEREILHGAANRKHALDAHKSWHGKAGLKRDGREVPHGFRVVGDNDRATLCRPLQYDRVRHIEDVINGVALQGAVQHYRQGTRSL